MMTTDSMVSDEFMANSSENLIDENQDKQLEVAAEAESSSGSSEISLSEKIIFESNEKRLRNRITSLQTSIMHLKEQLQLEKKLWKEDLEKIRTLQEQQQEVKHVCPIHCFNRQDISKFENTSRCSSIYSFMGYDPNGLPYPRHGDEIARACSVKQLLELHNYKRKLAETENMCNVELSKVKQSLQDLKSLQSISVVWGRDGKEDMSITESENNIHEIFVCDNRLSNQQ